jgi:CRISPR-associated endonuclease/helicase Cas3
MNEIEFDNGFEALTGNQPFPWQRALYKLFTAGNFPPACNLPTGLGKTAVIHIWLLALAQAPDKVPRRLVYVVNRRTVVDQSTNEARCLRERIGRVPGLSERLRELSASSDANGIPLAISTLRGQFADNREWSSDPARPAVVVGTVDMIGSRLLFSGYGCGFKSRPLHAGFLGQDVLLVHDEAHLEPAFQRLLINIECEQRRGRLPDFRPLGVMELTATSRAEGEQFSLTPDDYRDDTVNRRIHAKKGIAFHPLVDEKKTAAEVARLALKRVEESNNQPILIFLTRLEHVDAVARELRAKEQHVQLLTGTLRGYERDDLPNDPVFARFLPESNRPKNVTPREGTVYLICTSAGEVGINISAGHLVCDLTTFESMVQRFGRVNRFGSGDARIDIVHPAAFEPEGRPREAARERTLALLRQLPERSDGLRDASPHALGELPADRRQAAFNPPPNTLPTSDILFDAWALTSIHEPLPGRPPVAEYLHGVTEGEPPETYVAWREEVELLRDSGLSDKELGELLADYPLKPHELLRDQTRRVFEELEEVAARTAARTPPLMAWVVEPDGEQVTRMALGQLVAKDKQKKPQINLAERTVVLPPAAGGLRQGFLDGSAEPSAELRHDVADEWEDDQGRLRVRRYVRAGEEAPAPPDGMRRVCTVDVRELTDAEAEEPAEGGVGPVVRRVYFVRARAADDDGSKNARGRVPLDTHHRDIVKVAELLADRLLPEALRPVLIVSARFHDLGKRREVWQRSIGNTELTRPLAKSGKGGSLHGLNNYRHEFGSLLDIEAEEEFKKLSPDQQELVLHLIATHHGRGRPHFPGEEAFDLERAASAAARVAREVPRRYARLQRKYGRWGLAWFESLLRAADSAASANPNPEEVLYD